MPTRHVYPGPAPPSPDRSIDALEQLNTQPNPAVMAPTIETASSKLTDVLNKLGTTLEALRMAPLPCRCRRRNTYPATRRPRMTRHSRCTGAPPRTFLMLMPPPHRTQSVRHTRRGRDACPATRRPGMARHCRRASAPRRARRIVADGADGRHRRHRRRDAGPAAGGARRAHHGRSTGAAGGARGVVANGADSAARGWRRDALATPWDAGGGDHSGCAGAAGGTGRVVPDCAWDDRREARRGKADTVAGRAGIAVLSRGADP